MGPGERRNANMPRYKVNSVEELHMGLLGLDDEMNVEVAPGISISASTVRDLKR
jgi:hypothetical protein